ncbi:MAG: winged helix-turn-helix transcriptional regulator, partial [Nitrospirales bacterium]|nr:winged helix-turn-helix transcriptional regulator [Nitrospirales bacterium]
KAEIIHRHQEPTVPPQVTYGLTQEGRELTTILDQLNTLAHTWEDQVGRAGVNTNRPANAGKTLCKIS